MGVDDLVSYSLRVAGILGVGQVPLPQDSDDAATALQIMLQQWVRKRWLVYRLIEFDLPVVPGKPSYTIGPGGDFDAPRPANIDAAFIRQLIGTTGPGALPVDFPLRRIDSLEEWMRISLKLLQSWPGAFFYDPSIPTGSIYIWPIPIQNFFELHVAFPQDITDLAAVTDLDEIMPPEANEAAIYNLAGRLRINYQLPPNQDLNALARATLGTLRSTNYRIQKLRMPAALGRGGRWKNPMGGFYPETSVGVPYTTVGP